MYIYLHVCPLYLNTSLDLFFFFTEYSVVSFHPIKRSLAVILLQVVYFQKADHAEKKQNFLGRLSHLSVRQSLVLLC